MRIAYDFKKQTIEADNHYRKFIQDVNKKFQNLTHSEEYIEEEVIEEEQVYLDDDDDETKEIILETMGDDGQGHIIEDATTIMDIIEIKDEKHSDTIPEYMHEEQLFDAEEQDDGEVLVANDLGDDCDATIDDDDEEQYGDEVQDGRMLDGETIYDEEHLDDQQVCNANAMLSRWATMDDSNISFAGLFIHWWQYDWNSWIVRNAITH